MLKKTLFKKNRPAIIGAIHLPPLLGYPEFPGIEIAVKNALADLRAFERGGADAVIFENNYDNPHTVKVSPSVVASMALVGAEIRKATKLPVGIDVLWNDFKTAFALAKLLKLQFIRLAVFVDTVQTNYGVIRGEPREVIRMRKVLEAEDIELFVDIHVKHAKLLSTMTLLQSAKAAFAHQADGVIITGKWTGDAPDLSEVTALRKTLPRSIILAGSGIDARNIAQLGQYLDGAIVSTSLKKGLSKKREVNVKAYAQRIDQKRVAELMRAVSAKKK